MSTKTISFKSPPAPRNPQEWVQARAAAPSIGPTKRLTVNIPDDLHRRLKLDCVQRGLMISDMIRDMLLEKYPPTSPTHAGNP